MNPAKQGNGGGAKKLVQRVTWHGRPSYHSCWKCRLTTSRLVARRVTKLSSAVDLIGNSWAFDLWSACRAEGPSPPTPSPLIVGGQNQNRKCIQCRQQVKERGARLCARRFCVVPPAERPGRLSRYYSPLTINPEVTALHLIKLCPDSWGEEPGVRGNQLAIQPEKLAGLSHGQLDSKRTYVNLHFISYLDFPGSA